MVMRPNYADPAETAIKSGTVTIVRIVGGAVTRGPACYIDTGLGRIAPHFSGGLLFGRTPRQPHCVHVLARTDLTSATECLIRRRKGVEHVLVLGTST